MSGTNNPVCPDCGSTMSHHWCPGGVPVVIVSPRLDTSDAVREAERRGYLRGLRAAMAIVDSRDSDVGYEIDRLITEAEGETK